jgi:hypothetical protein
MSVICFDLQFSRSARPMTSFCILIAYINTEGRSAEWLYFFIKIYKQVIFQHECIVSPVQSASGKALHCAWHFHRRNSSVLSYIRFVMLYCIALPARVLFTIKIIIIIIWKSEAANPYTGLNSLIIHEIGGVRHQIYQRIIFCEADWTGLTIHSCWKITCL